MIGIYEIRNLENNKKYIGQSIEIEERWKDHISTSNNPNDKAYNYPLYQAFRKYGINNFSFQILEECSIEDLNDKEKFWIKEKKSRTFEHGYNQTEGGDSFPERIKKMDESLYSEIVESLKNIIDFPRQDVIATKFKISLEYVQGINTR